METPVEMLTLTPGRICLADWRAIYRGAALRLDPACDAAVAKGAEAIERILAHGEPVYGINTGFGKLASVRIADDELAVLQRNIVLSHAAGVGDPMPEPVVRLMMALKLVSLARGASGIRPETLGCSARCWKRICFPSSRRKGRWAPAATSPR